MIIVIKLKSIIFYWNKKKKWIYNIHCNWKLGARGKTNLTPQPVQEKTKVQLPEASKFCSWAIENGTSVAQWENETSLSSLASVNENVSFQDKW